MRLTADVAKIQVASEGRVASGLLQRVLTGTLRGYEDLKKFYREYSQGLPETPQDLINGFGQEGSTPEPLEDFIEFWSSDALQSKAADVWEGPNNEKNEALLRGYLSQLYQQALKEGLKVQ